MDGDMIESEFKFSFKIKKIVHSIFSYDGFV